MLSIKNLKANIDGKEILKGINLEMKPGEVHAIMGPNGSGKSTLAQVLAGNDNYEVTSGEVSYMGQDLLDLNTEQRALEGLTSLLSAHRPSVVRKAHHIVVLDDGVVAAEGSHEYLLATCGIYQEIVSEKSALFSS